MKSNPSQHLKILLAEDNQMNLKLATILLERMGHEVVPAQDGHQVLKAMQAERFDLVLMDLEMPEMDGIEATQRIRQGQAGEGHQQVPVVAMTAHTQSGTTEQCQAAGMNEYIAKPIDSEKLAALLARLF